jgi:multisubunit Na+/H+ antiporter MnhC subunit
MGANGLTITSPHPRPFPAFDFAWACGAITFTGSTPCSQEENCNADYLDGKRFAVVAVILFGIGFAMSDAAQPAEKSGGVQHHGFRRVPAAGLSWLYRRGVRAHLSEGPWTTPSTSIHPRGLVLTGIVVSVSITAFPWLSSSAFTGISEQSSWMTAGPDKEEED